MGTWKSSVRLIITDIVASLENMLSLVTRSRYNLISVINITGHEVGLLENYALM